MKRITIAAGIEFLEAPRQECLEGVETAFDRCKLIMKNVMTRSQTPGIKGEEQSRISRGRAYFTKGWIDSENMLPPKFLTGRR
ncbi:MAG: hypothetical protein A4E55_00912 [Pelotomaculum sp. PtaU1.Bin035]|nr:MAG: hypothetical protein A4E55_00912 [Pelotomaculum sp. PtaU1.Bin035]